MTTKKADAAHGDVQEQIDDETAKGYHGDKTDPVPDEEYTANAQGAINEAKKKES